MRIFGISDLHLSFTSDKPMDRFGPHWRLHHEKVADNWRRSVGPDDVVLLPGDHSWAMKIESALPDLEWIASLPGTKIMGKGNHDYWWHSLTKLEKLGLPGTLWLQNNAIIVGNVGICGSRGWALPGLEPAAQDEKIFHREQERIKLSFEALAKLRRSSPTPVDEVICMLHYPPLLADRRDTEFTRILEAAGVDICIYGHMHLSHDSRVFRGQHNGVRYEVVSCDFNDFNPLLLLETPSPSQAALDAGTDATLLQMAPDAGRGTP